MCVTIEKNSVKLRGLCGENKLFHFASRLNFAQYGSYGQRTVVVFGRENHTFADEAVLELARSQVGDEQYLFAYQLFGFVVLGDAAYDGTVLQTVGNLELEQLLHLGYGRTFEYGTYTDIELLELFERDDGLHGVSLVVGCLVGFLRSQQLVYLCLDGFVVNLLEQQFGCAQLMSGRQQVGASQVGPVEAFHVQHMAQAFAAEGQEGFEGNGQVGCQLQGDVQDGLYTVHVGLCQLPRFGVGQVLVTDAGQVHGFLLCIAELEYVEQLLYFGLHVGKFLQCFTVVVGQFATGGHYAVEVFLGKLQGTVYEVAIDGYQFVVVACLEVFPGEVVVLRLGSVGGEHVAQYVLFAGEVLQIFVQPNGPVTRSGYLVAFEIEEFVRGHIVRQNV